MKITPILYKYSILIFSISLVITSCSPKLAGNLNEPTQKVFYPQKSDTARIQYLTYYSKSTDILAKQSAFTSSIVGEEEIFMINKPYGIGIGNGKIYVCDLGINALEIIDLKNKKLDVIQPKLSKGYAQPINTFIDTDGNVYLASPLQRTISVYDPDMKYITEFGADDNHRPIDLCIKNNKVYVADIGNNRVNIFDNTTKELIGFFPDSVEGNDDWLYSPTAISISDNNIYITDTGDFSLKVFSLKGDFIKKIGEVGDNFGQFTRPKGNAVDKEDNVYVLDGAFENAQIFNKEGQLLLFFGGPYKGPGDMYLPAQITIDYKNTQYFEDFVDKRYKLMYLILVTNQFGPEKISVYGRIELKK